MILYVEDDESIRELVVYTLRNSGYDAQGCADGRSLYRALEEVPAPDLILLDIMLPDQDGITILKHLRRMSLTKETPVIMVTAKGAEYDKVIGLESGADDYVAKPFGMMELVSRVKAILRRTKQKSEAGDLTVAGIVLNANKHFVTVDGNEVTLTYKEFELLRMLMESAGTVLNRDRLLESIWGYEFDGETRTVDVHVRSLRVKLGDAGNLIETVRGVGYRIGTMK